MKKIINKFRKQVKETAEVSTERKLPDFDKTEEFDNRQEGELDDTIKDVSGKMSDSM